MAEKALQKALFFSTKARAMAASKPVMDPPGSYGIPILGALKDRLDFFWFQGHTEFFRSRMRRYNSTVFRVNFVPSPPGFPNSNGIALLDNKSFQILFDNEKVDKSDVFVGPFAPSTAYTGGFRVLSYLDPVEKDHEILKSFAFEILRRNGPKFLPEFATAFAESFKEIDGAVSKGGKGDVVLCAKEMAWNFLVRSIVHRDPAMAGPASLGRKGYSKLELWIVTQFGAIAETGLPHVVEEMLFHSFRLPAILSRRGYSDVANFFRLYATDALDVAANQFGITQDKAIHNLIFMVALNGWLAFTRVFPSLIYFIGRADPSFHVALRDEIRQSVNSNGGLTLTSLSQMPLLNSTVLEMLRLAPPVLYQYGRAKHDFLLESHEATFQIRKGELLGGSQEFATRDPLVFNDPETFLPDRFVGEKGQDLLKHVYWSNGRQTDSTSIQNKQCAAKGFVETVCGLFVAHMFLKYDTFSIGVDDHLGQLQHVTITSLTPSTSA